MHDEEEEFAFDRNELDGGIIPYIKPLWKTLVVTAQLREFVLNRNYKSNNYNYELGGGEILISISSTDRIHGQDCITILPAITDFNYKLGDGINPYYSLCYAKQLCCVKNARRTSCPLTNKEKKNYILQREMDDFMVKVCQRYGDKQKDSKEVRASVKVEAVAEDDNNDNYDDFVPYKDNKEEPQIMLAQDAKGPEDVHDKPIINNDVIEHFINVEVRLSDVD